MTISPGTWTWLEIAKLVVSLTGPIIVLVLGLWVKKFVDRIDQRRWANQSTITWRLSVFERLAPKLNLLLSTFTYVGRWKDLQPPDIIGLKRDLDEIIFTYNFLWSQTFRSNYNELMAACYELNQGPGKDAKIMANVEMFRHAHANWDPRWDSLFVSADERTRRIDIRRLAEAALRAAVLDLGLDLPQATLDGPGKSNLRADRTERAATQ